MSFKTWKQKFYPVAADSPVAAEDPVGHSLQKWLGLRDANLSKHGMRFSYGRVVDVNDDGMAIDSVTCALCVLHLTESCGGCPLATVRGGVDCCTRRGNETVSPYHAFAFRGNPEPMIEVLRAAAGDPTHV